MVVMVRTFALALALALSTAGCAQVVSHLPSVIAAVTDGMLVIDSIERFIDAFFRQKPSPDLEKKVRDGIARSRSALSAALRLAQGTEKLEQAQIDAAFADFKAAYTELLVILGPLGVQQQGTALRATPGGLIVPEPLALTFKLKVSK
jgi:hypothetical protein